MASGTMENRLASDARADDGAARPALLPCTPNPQPPLGRAPLPAEGDDVRPRQGMPAETARYFQGDALPATSSVLISNSRYLNNPFYREAFATQALRRHGPDLPPTYMVPTMARAFEEVADHDRFARLIAGEKLRFPAFGAWLDARDETSFRKEDLAGHPHGTLGHALFEVLSIAGIDMEFSSRARVGTSDVEYLHRRRSYLHDLEHIVTGFAANTAGENALSIMNATADARFFTPELAQMLSAGNMWISATGLFRTSLHYHHAMPTYLDAMQQGIAAGLALERPLFMVGWRDHLDRPLGDIAAMLGFRRGPGAEWDWTTDATNG